MQGRLRVMQQVANACRQGDIVVIREWTSIIEDEDVAVAAVEQLNG